jgi:alpha-tubulin suppressor-like RCC1 family protein
VDPRPVEVPGLAGTRMLTAGGAHTCALAADGTLACWGAGEAGQTGDPAGRADDAWHVLAGLTGLTAASAGGAYTCVLDRARAVRCFGLDATGQLGAGRALHSSWPRPVAVPCP